MDQCWDCLLCAVIGFDQIAEASPALARKAAHRTADGAVRSGT